MIARFFSGIFGHFFLRAIIIQSGLGLVLLAFVWPFFSYVTDKMAEEQGRTFSNSTLAATIDSLYKDDYANVVDYCMGVMKNTPNILFVAFSRTDGQEVNITPKHWTLEPNRLSHYDATPRIEHQSSEPNALFSLIDYLKPSDSFEFRRPIVIGGQYWGVLRVGFSKTAYISSIKSFLGSITFFIIVSCLLSSGLFFLSSRRIRKQLDGFVGVAQALSEGDLSARAPESGLGEIHVLGKAINNMSLSLQEKSEKISQLVKIVEQTNDAFILFSLSKKIIFVNEAAVALSGYPREYFIGVSLDDFTRLFNMNLSNLLGEIGGSLSHEQSTRCHDATFKKIDNSIINVELHMENITDEKGQIQNILLVLSDVTERKQAEQQLRIAATAFESQEGMLITDANGGILRVNQSFTIITGYSAEEVIGKNPRIFSSGRHDVTFYAAMWDSIVTAGAWEGEIWNRRKNGEIYPGHTTITAVKDENGCIANYVATFADITTSKAAAEKIEHLAFYDPLTHLPNRRLLVDRLQQALASSARSGRTGAVLFIDLDNFKTLNDTLGHDYGDLLLQQVATRLTTCVREGDTVARLGGDEFVVMLEDLSEQINEAVAETEVVVSKVLSALNQSYLLDAHVHHNTPSIGVTLFNGHEYEVDELLKHADIAMYQAKKAGRNTLRFFDPQMQQVIAARAEIENSLNAALEKGQFVPYYQIQMDHSHKPVGAELLIRWMHPERGLIPPAQFVPLAEDTGLILPIGLWVLDTACAQIRSWQSEPLARELVVSVNVSAKQFRHASFVSQVEAAIRRHDINPARLKLELTESILVESIEDTIAKMLRMKELGVSFSLDDFGTGYSSLQYLKRLPLDQLKIDQSFVRDIVTDGNDRSIVRTIVAMASSMDFNIIAEGVETEEQRHVLLQNGCTYYQGYLFGRPVPIDEFEKLLKQG